MSHRPAAGSAALFARLTAQGSQIWSLWHWAVSLWSLLLGLLTIFVFRRGLPHVGWIVGYVLLLWFVFAALTEWRAPLEERGRQFVVGASEYAIQTLYHNLLLFVLPAYYAAATLDAPNGMFVAAVTGSAVLTAIDPWYRRVVHPRPWLQHALLGFSMFSALNVALPLVGIQPLLAVESSAALSVMGLTPAFRRIGRVGWGRAGARAALVASLAFIAAWCGRSLVPPAPLFIARATAARLVSGLEPVDVVGASIPASTVAEWGSLAAFTAVYAPSGLHQSIAHVWSRNGVTLARIPLSPVLGGRTEGFRTYSVIRNLKPPLDGRYRVDVVTASGQLIGRLRFSLTP